MNPASNAPWQDEVILRQLERMRGMQYAYHRKFFNWISGIAILIVLAAVWPDPIARLLLPFIVITAGVQASFFLHFCDFARIHSRSLEKLLNSSLGRRLLIASDLEECYFYPLDAPKISGWTPSASGRFFCFFTLHWCAVWTTCSLWGIATAWNALPIPSASIYTAAVLLWGAVNIIWITLYFWRRSDATAMQNLLDQQLGRPSHSEEL